MSLDFDALLAEAEWASARKVGPAAGVTLDLDALLAEVEGGLASMAQVGVGISQRWRDQRDFYRSNEERFAPSNWRAELLAGSGGLPGDLGRRNAWKDGRAFILRNHYAASFPQARIMVGMFRARDARLVGVATFSNADADQARKYGNVGLDEIVELSRFVLLDEVPGNAETWFLARATTLARELHTVRTGNQIKVLLSFSDPVPRRSTAGFLTMPGHIGNIYQAHNAVFVGRSRAKTLHLTPAGVAPDPRMLSKIRSLGTMRPEKGGREGARRFVEDYGAPRRRRGESYRAWVKRGLASPAFRRLSHTGNLIYLWSFGGRRDRRRIRQAFPESLPYPKTPRQLYLNLRRKYDRAFSRGLDELAKDLQRKLLTVWLTLNQADQASVPALPSAGIVCGVAGSRNRRGQTLEQILARVVC